MRHRPPVTRGARPRQLPTVPSHAVPTGEYQSDPPSLPRAVRCSSPRGDPSNPHRALDVSLHIRTLVGLDVHATKIVAAVLDAEIGELRWFSVGGDAVEAA